MVVVGNALVTICYKRQIPTPRTQPGHTHSIFIAGIKTRKSKRNPSYTCVSCRRPNTYWVERSIAQRRLRRETEVVTFKMALMKTDSWGDQRVAGSQDPSLQGTHQEPNNLKSEGTVLSFQTITQWNLYRVLTVAFGWGSRLLCSNKLVWLLASSKFQREPHTKMV